MKARLAALAAAVSLLGAGAALFFNWESAEVEGTITSVGNWEMIDKSSCTMRLCNAPACDVARDHLADAGRASCDPRFFACDFRITQKVRNLAADAGVTLGPQKYQRLELVALRCPAIDGGFAFGVPMDDSGWPIYAVSQTVPRCVRAPLDGGLTCRRDEKDGGSRFFGTGNVFPSGEAIGTGCEACGCTVVYGDSADTDL